MMPQRIDFMPKNPLLVGPEFKGIGIPGHTGAFEVEVVCEDGTVYICHSRKKTNADEINFDVIPEIVKKIEKARKMYLDKLYLVNKYGKPEGYEMRHPDFVDRNTKRD
jgi:hypothetical protein